MAFEQIIISLDPFTERLARMAIHGHDGCIEYVRQLTDMQLRAPEHATLIDHAARRGHMRCVRYLMRHGCQPNNWSAYDAAWSRRVACLRYLCVHGCPACQLTTVAAAACGHLVCLKYAHVHGVPWDVQVCASASANGNLDCLVYAIDHGALCNENAPIMAARRNHLSCLEYMCENVPFEGRVDRGFVHSAIIGGSLRCLAYLHQRAKRKGTQWCNDAGDIAVLHDRLECLRYLYSHSASTTRCDARCVISTTMRTIRYIHNHRHLQCPSWNAPTLREQRFNPLATCIASRMAFIQAHGHPHA